MAVFFLQLSDENISVFHTMGKNLKWSGSAILKKKLFFKIFIDDSNWYYLLINNNYYILITNSILKSFNTNKRWSKFKFQFIVLFKSLKIHFLERILSLFYRLIIMWYKWVILYILRRRENYLFWIIKLIKLFSFYLSKNTFYHWIISFLIFKTFSNHLYT